jgi:hypothetical protein
MPEQNKVKGPASYFPSIEKTYGKSLSHWMKVLNAMKRKNIWRWSPSLSQNTKWATGMLMLWWPIIVRSKVENRHSPHRTGLTATSHDGLA